MGLLQSKRKLCKAIKDGDYNLVIELLEDDRLVPALYENILPGDHTVITLACEVNNYDMVCQLFDRGAKSPTITLKMLDNIHSADILQLLFDNGSKIEMRYNLSYIDDGLYVDFNIHNVSLDVVKVLHKNGLELSKLGNGWFVHVDGLLEYFVKHYKIEQIHFETLLFPKLVNCRKFDDLKIFINNYDKKNIKYFFHKYYSEICRIICRYKENCCKNKQYYDIIKCMLDNGADPNVYNYTPPIICASIHGKPNIVKLLLDYGSRTTYGKLSAYKKAGLNKKIKKLIIDHEKNKNSHKIYDIN